MILTKIHIKISLTRLALYGGLLLFILGSCAGSKKVEQSIFNQRKPFKELLHSATSEKLIGHHEKAIELYEQCLIIEPTNPAVHFALSDLYETKKNNDKALFHAEKAYAYNKTNKWYILRLADLYFKQEKYAETADLYALIIEDEKNIDFKFNYVETLIRSNRFTTAIDILNEIEVETGKIPEVCFTKHDLYLELGKPVEAQQELDNLLNENPNELEYKITVAEFYMQQNLLDKSKNLLSTVIAQDPNYGLAYFMMADLELRADNLKGAFANLEIGFTKEDVELERKLDILRSLIPYANVTKRDYATMRTGIQHLFDLIYDPVLKNSMLHEYYGNFLFESDKFDEATKQYQIACDLNPGSFETWIQLFSLQNKQNDFNGMYLNGKKASEIFPAQPLVYLFAGIGAKEKKLYEEAEEWFFLGKELVIRDAQLSSEFLYHLGDMNYRLGNETEGDFYFQEALKAFPGNEHVHGAIAKKLIETKQLDAAESELIKALELAPKSIVLHEIYGDLLFNKKEYTKAANHFLRALLDNYADFELLEKYGDALFLSGDETKALDVWAEAIRNGNKSLILQRKLADKKYYEAN